MKQLKKQTPLHNTKTLEDVGKYLKMRRLKLGLKAVEIAEKMGISKQLISNFEHGKSNNLTVALNYLEVLRHETDKQRAKQRVEPPE